MIGKQLRQLRMAKGYSLRELAKISGLSHSFLSDIEHDRCNPSLCSLYKLANALEVKPEIFLQKEVVINDHTTGEGGEW